jgi:hypothetical protein
MFKTTSLTACPCSQQKEKRYATKRVVKADTMLSPMPGVTQEGHCQLGMDPTPRASHTESKLAMWNYPWGSRRSYLKMILARLSILILSKTTHFVVYLAS